MSDLTSQSPEQEYHGGYRPLVAVIGRPNVGKSTLFNRLIKKRRAITDPTPGVTRDPIMHEWDIDGSLVRLVDTGGYKAEGGGIDRLVREKSISYLKQADCIVFLMDVSEVSPEDEAFMDFIRPYADKLVLVVNKVDNPQREDAVWNYYSYGLGDPVAISAAHGIGIDLLEERVIKCLEEQGAFEKTALSADEGSAEDAPVRLAVLGKPNTGKSTLTNRLIGREVSIVSDVPGTTRDVIENAFSYKDTPFTILDTAGIRRKKKVGQNIEYYSVNRAFTAIEDSDIVLLMIDAQEGLTEQDKKICTQIIKRGKGVILVLNKWDLVKEIPNMMQAIQDRVRFLFPVLAFAPLLPISAANGDGLDELFKTLLKVRRQLVRRVDTAKLNAKLKEWGERYQPPRGKRGHYKVLYGTQVDIEPPRFLLFVNRKSGFPQGYISYLNNNIRKELGFDASPLVIDLKERRR